MTTYVERADEFVGGLGFEAYRVGGSVRDELLGRKPKDADYVVRGASLAQLFDTVQAQGRDIRVSPLKLRDGRVVGARVARKGLGMIEIALPRTEKSTGPGHRDFTITVDQDIPLSVDAKRRDFTFNALYRVTYNHQEWGEILDPTGHGIHDLQHRIVRVTHADSFRDDPLRTLRALRFVSTLAADLDPETRALMALHHKEVTGLTAKGVSGTVLDELKKLLMGHRPDDALRIARDTGVLAIVLPELAPMLGFDQGSRYHDMTTDEHTFAALAVAARVGASLRVRMALLFHDAGKPEAAWEGKDGRMHYYAAKHPVTLPGGREVVAITEDHEVVSERLWRSAAARLNVERKLRNDVSALILNHMIPPNSKKLGVRVGRMRVKFGDELLSDLFMHRCCDLSGKKAKITLSHIEHVQRMERTRKDLFWAGVPASIKQLKVNGEDAKALGLEGKQIGDALARVLDEVVCRPDEQTMSREWQLRRLEAQ